MSNGFNVEYKDYPNTKTATRASARIFCVLDKASYLHITPLLITLLVSSNFS